MVSSQPGATSAAQRRPRLMSPAREDSFQARLIARDERALAELVDLASPWLLGLVQGILNDPDEAEDVVVETFRVAWEKTPPIGAGARGLVPWLLEVARNRAIDRLRARRRRIRLGEQFLGEMADHTSEPPSEPNEAARPGWRVHTEVHRALAELPDEQRQAVRLAYFEGRTHSEIAEGLEIPLGTVKTRLRLGLGRLRERLASLKDWVV
jgi:RNA polymerase sigma-70 factor (ECF subfamily)